MDKGLLAAVWQYIFTFYYFEFDFFNKYILPELISFPDLKMPKTGWCSSMGAGTTTVLFYFFSDASYFSASNLPNFLHLFFSADICFWIDMNRDNLGNHFLQVNFMALSRRSEVTWMQAYYYKQIQALVMMVFFFSIAWNHILYRTGRTNVRRFISISHLNRYFS